MTPEKFNQLITTDDRSGMGEVTTPIKIVEDMIKLIPEDLFISPSSTFLDPAFGSGTFIDAIIKKLRKYGHSMENIQERIYGFEVSHRLHNKLTKELSVYYNFHKLYKEDFLTKDFNNMKFDVVIGNPPYNLRKGDGGKSGTIGDKTYYRKFVTKAFECVDDNGIVLYVTLKNVLSHLDKLDKQVDYVNLMTDVDYWKYDTLIFLARNRKRETVYTISDPIIKKMYTTSNEWDVKTQASSLMQMERDKGATISTSGTLLKLPGKVGRIYGTLPEKIELYRGPKFMFTILESIQSYTVTDEVAYPHCACIVTTDSLTNASKLELFVKNNKAFKFFNKKVKTKGYAIGVKKLIKFDLNQIETGFEYPVEFKLTQEEIDLIESAVA